MVEADKERLAKIMAHRGVCSRREAEVLILKGHVRVNGVVWKELGKKVSVSAQIEIDGQKKDVPHTAPIPKLWLYHKPSGLVCSHKPQKNQRTVFSAISETYPNLPRLISVGRLDLNTQGLLLMTNNGAIARKLELPESGWKRQYKVRIFGRLLESAKHKIEGGIKINGTQYQPITCEILPSEGKNQWISLTLTEGKNREIRNIMAFFELPINRLVRTSYGPFDLGSLPPNHIKEVPHNVLLSKVGPS